MRDFKTPHFELNDTEKFVRSRMASIIRGNWTDGFKNADIDAAAVALAKNYDSTGRGAGLHLAVLMTLAHDAYILAQTDVEVHGFNSGRAINAPGHIWHVLVTEL